MRDSTFAAAALLAGAADIALAVPAAGCNDDNCLRAFGDSQVHARLEDAQSFCASFTAKANTTVPIPAFALDACAGGRNNASAAARVSSACACIAPTTTPATPTAKSNEEPCAVISSIWQAATALATIQADLAMDCLKTVPLGKKEAIELVDSIAPYLDWQSDAAYKKDPPPSYGYPGYDMFANLANVKSNIEADHYDGEYAFQEDLYKTVFLPGADSHFLFSPDVVARALSFGRAIRLVSISDDGKSLPKIKFTKDVVQDPQNAPVVEKINGVDAAKFIEESGNSAPLHHDVDATYNSQFDSRAKSATGVDGFFMSQGRQAMMYQGSNTTITLVDGRSQTWANVASLRGNWSGVVDGPSYYKKFCTPVPEIEDTTSTVASNDTTPVKRAGDSTPSDYPQPNIATKHGEVTGHYLTGEGFNDVAVLTVLDFVSDPRDFQAVVAGFLRQAKAAGKKKLIVDLQENSGGLLHMAHDLFGQLFPSIVQESTFRFKENEDFTAAARAISDVLKDVDVTTTDNASVVEASTSRFNYRNDLNVYNRPFLTFDDKFSPHEFKDTKYTNLMRYNLNDPLSTSNTTFGSGIKVSGNGAASNATQPFAAKDMILLTDGACASACSVFAEMMRVQGGVKSVVFGGRPREGPMQSIGGVKGSEVYTFKNIRYSMRLAELWTKDPVAKARFARYNDLPMQRSLEPMINARDQIQEDNIDDGTPSQFVTRMADCRLYWTAPMIKDVTEIWKAGANVAFNGHQCAHGKIPGSSRRRRRTPGRVFTPRVAQRLSDKFH